MIRLEPELDLWERKNIPSGLMLYSIWSRRWLRGRRLW
jgi:hypothetical protein